jgi:transposase
MLSGREADPNDDRCWRPHAIASSHLALVADPQGADLEFDRRIMAWHRCNEMSKRLHETPGVGPALATALVASVANPKAFRSG